MTILVAYDGSEGADAAIAAVGRLLGRKNATAVALTVWEPLTVVALRAVRFGSQPPIPVDVARADEKVVMEAKRLAEHGARLAGEAGFETRALWVADEKRIADTIVAAADELDVDLIVMGARGLAGIHAFLGSVSNRVVQHAHRPVMVVPSPVGASAGELDEPAAVSA